MADIRVPVQEIPRGGLDPTYMSGITTTDVYLVNNDGRVALIIKDTHTEAIIVTLVTPGTVDGNAIADRTFSIDADDEGILPFMPPEFYNDKEHDLRFTFSNVVSLEIAAVRF